MATERALFQNEFNDSGMSNEEIINKRRKAEIKNRGI